MENLKCKFCGDIRKNANSLRGHERLCKENPDREFSKFSDNEWQKEKGTNQYIKAKEKGEVYVISEETRKKFSKSATGKKHSESFKLKQRENAIKNNLGGVTQSRWIKYNGKTLGSSFELELVKDLDKNNIKWDTCSRISYIDNNGNKRTYTPDIYLIDFDIYLDPKNDFLIENINPNLGFKDSEKIQWVCEQNNIKCFILNKTQLSWEYIYKNILNLDTSIQLECLNQQVGGSNPFTGSIIRVKIC